MPPKVAPKKQRAQRSYETSITVAGSCSGCSADMFYFSTVSRMSNNVKFLRMDTSIGVFEDIPRSKRIVANPNKTPVIYTFHFQYTKEILPYIVLSQHAVPLIPSQKQYGGETSIHYQMDSEGIMQVTHPENEKATIMT